MLGLLIPTQSVTCCQPQSGRQPPGTLVLYAGISVIPVAQGHLVKTTGVSLEASKAGLRALKEISGGTSSIHYTPGK